jgi:hypothetical protein
MAGIVDPGYSSSKDKQTYRIESHETNNEHQKDNSIVS